MPEDITAHTVDGKIYGIRMIDDPQFFFYRKSLLEKARSSAPTTFDELIDAAAKLTTGKVKGLYIGNDLQTVINPLVWSAGADTSPRTTRSPTTRTTSSTGIKECASCHQRRLLLGAPTETGTRPASSRGCARSSGAGYGRYRHPEGVRRRLRHLPLPQGRGQKGRPVVYNGGWSTFVNAKAKHVDGAKEFVKWLWIDQKKYQQDWAPRYGFHIPPRTSIAAGRRQAQDGTAGRGRSSSSTSHGLFDDPSGPRPWSPS